MTSIQTLRSKLDQQRGKQQQTKDNLQSEKQRLARTNKSLDTAQKAREVIDEVGLKTQQQLAFHISDITTLAMESVFEDEAYELIVDFVKRRNKTECDLLFKKNGNTMSPMDASGGGAVDVASFALRVASWSMQNPHSRATIVLDEPMKFLSKDKQPKASQMLKELSEKLNIQFIIVTHKENLTDNADKVFEVKQSKGKSHIN